jgi:transcriptional regulator with XRE-family HTH domain
MSLDTTFPLGSAPPTRSASAAPKEIHVRVGAAIRRRRRAVEITLHELAQFCGVSFQQVQKYESGASAISAATLWNLACALRVPISYFYETDPSAEA